MMHIQAGRDRDRFENHSGRPERHNENTDSDGSRGRLSRAAHLAGNGLFVLVLVFMALLVFSLVQSRVVGGPPEIFSHQVYIVEGGSMSPAIEAGSLSIVQPVSAADVEVGDIITYHGTDEQSLTTHRVMEVHEADGDLSFTTRGDANRVDDPLPVTSDLLIGRVVRVVPYAGVLLDFAQSRTGLLALVIIPGILVIGFEVRNLLHLSAQMDQEEEESSTEERTTVDV